MLRSRIRALGIEEAIRVTIQKNPNLNADEIDKNLRKLYADSISDLAKEYIFKKNMPGREALVQAAADFRCTDPSIIINATFEVTMPKRTSTKSYFSDQSRLVPPENYFSPSEVKRR